MFYQIPKDDKTEEFTFCRGLFDELVKTISPPDVTHLDPQRVADALEIIKEKGDIHPDVAVSLQEAVLKVYDTA